MSTLEYLTDDGPSPMDGGGPPQVLVLRRGGNGDYYLGTRDVNGRETRTVRFRTANGGASDRPGLIGALAALERALAGIST